MSSVINTSQSPGWVGRNYSEEKFAAKKNSLGDFKLLYKLEIICCCVKILTTIFADELPFEWTPVIKCIGQ